MDVVEQVNNGQHRSKYTQYKQKQTNRQIGYPVLVVLNTFLPGMGSRQFCRGRGRGRGREVEAEARQGSSNVLNRGEARQRQRQRQRARGRGEAERNRYHFDIMHNAHVVVTCSCFVVNDIYQ